MASTPFADSPAVDDQHAFAIWESLPVSNAIQARRIKHLQQLGKNPEIHVQEVSAVFGALRFESKRSMKSPTHENG